MATKPKNPVWGTPEVEPYVTGLIANAHAIAEKMPKFALVEIRQAAEAICYDLFAREIGKPGEIMLEQMIGNLFQNGVTPRRIQAHLASIQKAGNFSAHASLEHDELTLEDVEPALGNLDQVAAWYFTKYLRKKLPERLAAIADLEPDTGEMDLGEAPTARAEPAAALNLPVPGKPVRVLPASGRSFVLVEAGHWMRVDEAIGGHQKLPPLPATGAAIVDATNNLVVAAYDAVLNRSKKGEWEELRLPSDAQVLCLAALGDAIVAGDAMGRVFRFAKDAKEAELLGELGSPVGEVLALGAGKMAIGTRSGAVYVWEGALRRIDGPRAYELFASSEARVWALGAAALFSIDVTSGAVSPVGDLPASGVRSLVRIATTDRSAVVSEAGEVWILTERSTWMRVRLPSSAAPALGVVSAGAPSAFVWTEAGEVFRVRSDGSLRKLAIEGVCCAASTAMELVFVRRCGAEEFTIERRPGDVES